MHTTTTADTRGNLNHLGRPPRTAPPSDSLLAVGYPNAASAPSCPQNHCPSTTSLPAASTKLPIIAIAAAFARNPSALTIFKTLEGSVGQNPHNQPTPTPQSTKQYTSQRRSEPIGPDLTPARQLTESRVQRRECGAYWRQLISAQYLWFGCSDVTFSKYGAYWRQARKICVTELLSSKRVGFFQVIRAEETGRMLSNLVVRSKPFPLEFLEFQFGISGI